MMFVPSIIEVLAIDSTISTASVVAMQQFGQCYACLVHYRMPVYQILYRVIQSKPLTLNLAIQAAIRPVATILGSCGAAAIT